MRKLYRFLSGVDNTKFWKCVSDALAEGYVLYGNPVMVMDKDVRMLGQVVILSKIANRHTAPAD